MLANFLAKDWIPNNFEKPILLLTAGLLCVPILFLLKPTLRIERIGGQKDQEALERWESFEQQQTASPFFDN